jgi:hypothetical protein
LQEGKTVADSLISLSNQINDGSIQFAKAPVKVVILSKVDLLSQLFIVNVNQTYTNPNSWNIFE